MAGPVLSPIPTLFTFINTLNNMSLSLNIAKYLNITIKVHIIINTIKLQIVFINLTLSNFRL